MIMAAGIVSSAFAVGVQPHDVASRDGDVVATSLGTDFISIVEADSTFATYIDVGAPSWGVCFAGAKAYVTMPQAEEVAILDFSSGTPSAISGTISVPRGCSEIIADKSGETLYVANVGASTASSDANAWQQSVLKIPISSPGSYATFATERQPRALALSPDESRLFVGTVQGALGQSGLGTDATGTGFTDPWDGGSVLVHDSSTGAVQWRIGVGSPVRGIVALADSVYAGSPNGDYRVYFTHVGEGVQSEDPNHGGRAIPNVLSSVLMSSQHVPQSRQDTIFKHAAVHSLAGDGLPAVLPEKLVVIDSSSKAGYAAELWVTNSASGTVSRAWISIDTGSVATSGSHQQKFPSVDSRTEGNFGFTITDSTSITYGLVDPSDHVRSDDEASELYRSRPRGITIDSASDQVIVCTESRGDLVYFDSTDSTLGASNPGTLLSVGDPITGYARISKDTGNFFTFGEGFRFRETVAADNVDNLSCGTCHVDGHIDGKVRLTLRGPTNRPVLTGPEAEDRMVTAVPSMFDAVSSEWIFFEGLRTIEDRGDRFTGQDDCDYCDKTEFFLSTIDFSEPTRKSPHESLAGGLSDSAARGRAWFDAMNCSRCHSDDDDIEFRRTSDPAAGQMNLEFGPLVPNRHVLSDPRQVFIEHLTNRVSFRNMTDVGSRKADPTATIDPAGNAYVLGVNTPGLAGAWDNRPYFHDGRYRTLDEVLDHTWVDTATGQRAARVWGATGVPDNLFDNEDYPIPGSEANLPVLNHLATLVSAFTIDGDTLEVKEFMTHAHVDPGANWTSVKSYLGSLGGYDDLLAFLKELNSKLDPYPEATPSIDSLQVALHDALNGTLTWSTPFGLVSHYEITNDATSDIIEGVTGPGMAHEIDFTMAAAEQANWTASVSTNYGEVYATDTVEWFPFPQFTNASPSTGALTVPEGKTPSASVALDYDNDGYEDLALSFEDNFFLLNNGDGNFHEAAAFTERRANDLAYAFLENTRGLVAADIDADGFADLFISSPDSNLICMGDSLSLGTVGTALLGSAKTLDAIGGSFGDYNGDHWLDLYIMSSAAGTGDILLENALGDSLVNVTSAAGLITGQKESTSAVWADIDLDGRSDLLVGWGDEVGGGDDWSLLYLNEGEDANGQFKMGDVAGAATGPSMPKIGHVNALQLADVSGDGILDILCATDSVGAADNLIVLINDGSGVFAAAPDSLGLNTATQLLDVEVSDLNGNGVLDVIALPNSAVAVEVFSGFGEESERVYINVSDVVVLGSDLAYGVTVADYNRDSDPDIFLLRPEDDSGVEADDENFFWTNGLVDKTNPPDRNRFFTVELRLDTNESSNPNIRATGAIVTSTIQRSDGKTLKSTQLVDGGSGHASQGAHRLVFGLADATTATLQVRWPSGGTQNFSVSGTDTADSVVHRDLSDTSNPVVLGATISASYVPTYGYTTHTYTWKTRHRCDDVEVNVTAGSRASASCKVPLGGDSSKDLDPSQSDVAWTQVQDGDDWLQTLTWNPYCSSPCTYSYTVKGVVGGFLHSGQTKTLNIGACAITIP